MKNTHLIWSELALLSLLTIVTRLPWLFMVPMAEAPDESSHYWVVKFIFEHARLPSHADVFSNGSQAVYGSLPQVGYLPHVLLSQLLPFWQLTVTGRLGSLLMGLLLIAISYLIARELHSENRLSRLALPLVVIFHPQVVLLHSYINSDSTAACAAAAIFLIVIKMIKKGLSFGYSALLGLFGGIAILSKYAALSAALAGLFGLILAGFLNGASWLQTISALGMSLSVFALSVNWWFLRQASEYPGDLLGTKAMRHIWAVSYHRPLVYKQSLWQIARNFSWWRMMYFSYWGMFGYMTRYLWRPFYIAYFLYTLSSLAGLFRWLSTQKIWQDLICLRAESTDWETQEKHRLALQRPAVYLVFGLAIVINLAAMIWSSSLNLGGAQGRYLFACEIPIIALTLSGLRALYPSKGTALVGSFVIFNVVVYIWSFVILFRAYVLGL